MRAHVLLTPAGADWTDDLLRPKICKGAVLAVTLYCLCLFAYFWVLLMLICLFIAGKISGPPPQQGKGHVSFSFSASLSGACIRPFPVNEHGGRLEEVSGWPVLDLSEGKVREEVLAEETITAGQLPFRPAVIQFFRI